MKKRTQTAIAKKPSRTTVKAPKTFKAKVAHHTKKLLVPHKGNEYRPHIIRAQGIIAVLIIALLAQIVYSVVTTGRVQVLAQASDISVAELLADTNSERLTAGLEPLTVNEQLNNAAALKAQDMFANNYWAHVSPTGVQPWEWFAQAGYTYSSAGENLAKNYPNAAATVAAWMASDSHRENILKEAYVDVGFAVLEGELEGEPTTLVVALYGAQAPLTGTEAGTSRLNQTFTAANVDDQNIGPVAYFGLALGALSPVTIAVLGLLAVVAIVGVVAHHNRHKLPKTWRKNWRQHHGLYTFVGMIVLGVLVIVGSHTGQI